MRTTPLLAALLLAAPAGLIAQTAPARPSPSTGEPWQIVPLPQSSVVLGRDGSLVGEIGSQWRTSISIKTLPKYVGQAFVAVEDHRFYQHNGVDVVGIAGALKDAIRGEARGASTITQQLVGNMHPDIINRAERSGVGGVGRKLREQQAALEMERHYSKEQVLEAYLNTIHFGHQYYGIESAARHYFGKPASRLTLAEAASLAAMPKGPALWDPVNHPDRNKERRNTVLSLMAEQGYITPAQAAAAQAEPIVTASFAGMSAPAPYFVDAVRREAERAGVNLAEGGFRIWSTLDPAMQRAAVVALEEGAQRVETRPGFARPTRANHRKGDVSYLQGAVVALEPTTGEVLALVGGRDFAESPYNRAVLGMRQPGSSFKPIVYATALAARIPANTIVYDTALAIPLDNGRVYRPENSDGKFLGPMTMREAMAKSRNPVAVQLAQEVTLDSVVATARRMGLTTPIAPYPSSALGASAVHPLDFVGAFTAIDNAGAAAEPRLIRRVEDRTNRVAYAAPNAIRPALDSGVAFIVRDMMRDVVERGTATSVRKYLPASVPVAGKTGTPNDNTDVWFVGMTPEVVAGVWLGFDRPQTIAPGAFGGTLAAPIFGQMLAAWYQGREPGSWTPPAGVVSAELDRDTGLPATADTPPERRYTEWFLEGTEPGAVKPNAWTIFSAGPIIP